MNFIQQVYGTGFFKIFHCNFQCVPTTQSSICTTHTIMLFNIQSKKFTICDFLSLQKHLDKKKKTLDIKQIYKIKFRNSFTCVFNNNCLYEYIIVVQDLILHNGANDKQIIQCNLKNLNDNFFLITKIQNITVYKNMLLLHCHTNEHKHTLCFLEKNNVQYIEDVYNFFSKILKRLIIIVNVDFWNKQEGLLLIFNRFSIITILDNPINITKCSIVDSQFHLEMY